MIYLSDEQRRAVEHPFDDACVVAGAGSGKTRVLTERYLRLVTTHRVGVRRLPALTFTEKAASEMRSRIRARLLEAGRTTDASQVAFAPIQTLHAYCASLLRSHALDAGLDPAFRVLDGGEARLVLEEAAERAEGWLHTHAGDALAALAPIDGRLPRAHLLHVLARIRGAGRSAQDVTWVSGAVRSSRNREGSSDRETSGNRDHAGARAQALRALADMASAAQTVAVKSRPPIREALAEVEALLAMPAASVLIEGFRAFEARDLVKACTRVRKDPFGSAKAAAAQALDVWGGAALDAFGQDALIGPLRTVLCAYEDHYARAKRERWALDFTDLERRAVSLLASRADALVAAPQALLVDEYQDTNPLQAQLLAHLRRFAPQFSVGDPKQSIYRFRGADVRVLLSEWERVGDAGTQRLCDSYRAVPELVHTLNALHARLFAGDAAGVPYEPLRAAGQFASTDGTPPVSVAFVRTDDVPIDEARMREARWIAEQIDALVAASTPRRRKDAAAPIRFGDIAVLMRARSSLHLYEAALEERGIPFLTLKGTGYFVADELRDLVYVLRVIHNPGDDFALACTLTGPAFGLSETRLLPWFGFENERPWDRLWADRASLASGTRRRLEVLVELQRCAVTGALVDVVSRVLHELGLVDVALAVPGGARRAANLRKAVDVARRMASGGHQDLGVFLRHLGRLQDRGVPEPFAPVGGDGDNVVRLTTVHGAKGLEYPVVFLADAGRAAGGGAVSPIRADDDAGVACRLRDPLEGRPRPSGGFRHLAAREARADAQEALRLLYVATTRAEERLIISAPMTGVTRGDVPRGALGWARGLHDVLRAPLDVGARDISLRGEPASVVRYEVVDGAAYATSPAPPADAVPPPDGASRARALWKRVEADAAAGCEDRSVTRFVVSVSDIVAFAHDPQAYYERCLGTPSDVEGDDVDGVRARDGDAKRTTGDALAEGAALHAFVEHLDPADPHPLAQVDAALAMAFASGVPADSHARVHSMAQRFLQSGRGRQTRRALRDGQDVRRELALHARIDFPRGASVGGFPALLVNGTIDLWLPCSEAGGVVIVDHKTNRRSTRFPTPASVAAHYAWQLRLYALMAERLHGNDIAGAELLLLDPSWGAEALSVPVAIDGAALEDTRRLCQALATAERQQRFPKDWRDLLEGPNA